MSPPILIWFILNAIGNVPRRLRKFLRRQFILRHYKLLPLLLPSCMFFYSFEKGLELFIASGFVNFEKFKLVI